MVPEAPVTSPRGQLHSRLQGLRNSNTVVTGDPQSSWGPSDTCLELDILTPLTIKVMENLWCSSCWFQCVAQCLIAGFLFSDANGFGFFSPSELDFKNIRNWASIGKWQFLHLEYEASPHVTESSSLQEGKRGKRGSPFFFPACCGSLLVCVRFEMLYGSIGFRHRSMGCIGRLCSVFFPNALRGGICQGFQNWSCTEHVIAALHI